MAGDDDTEMLHLPEQHQPKQPDPHPSRQHKAAGVPRQRRPSAKRRAFSEATAEAPADSADRAFDELATHADDHKPDAVSVAAKAADAGVAEKEAAAGSPAGKPKRKYVKSGKFVGKYNSWKQKQGQEEDAAADGQANAAVKPKRKRGSPSSKQKADSNSQMACQVPDSGAAQNVGPSPDSQEKSAAVRKKGSRSAGSNRKARQNAVALHQPANVEAGGAGVPALAVEQAGAQAAEEAAAAEGLEAHQSQAQLTTQSKPVTGQGVVADQSNDSRADIAGPSTDSMLNGCSDSRAEGQLESALAMARKASTGDGSRLVRHNQDTDSETIDSAVEATGAAQSALSPSKKVHVQKGQGILGRPQTCSGPTDGALDGVAESNTAGTADRSKHRLSRVTGQNDLNTDGEREQTPIGENDGPLHRNDSTFGEYMATLERRSSSSLNRRLTGAGNTERLLEMLHGSDGWERLACKLEQKEAEEAKDQLPGADKGHKAAGKKRSRKDALLADTRQAGSSGRQENEAAKEQTAGGATTEDSTASRPKRARAKFDYSILNGTSGNISAFIQEPDPPKPAKKRRVTKLDKEGNKPEVSVYAKAYNKVKAQFVRIRLEETLLDAYGADAQRGPAKERVKLQSEMDRAQRQVEKCKTVVRECVKFCEDAEGDRAIPSECYDSDGELPERHIFCAKCHTGDSLEDNDIVLCDGECGRAYHEQCLQPRIHASELPEDEGWLCHACDAKADMILAINEEFGTSYDEAAAWHSLFAEEPQQRMAAAPAEEGAGPSSGPATFLNMDLGASDSDDSSFGSEDMSDEEVAHQQEDKQDGSAHQLTESEAGSAASSARSSSSTAGSGSDDSSDSGLAHLDEEEQEAIAGLAGDIDVAAPRSKRVRALRESSHADQAPEVSETSGLTPSEATSDIVTGKRKRQHIDYKALNDSMFGNTECYEGEGLAEADVEYAPLHKRRTGESDSD